MRRILAGALLAAGLCPGAIQFRHQVLEADLGIGYAVLCVDVDADGDTDVVALSEDKVAWWSNPDWEKHVILDGVTEADNVAIAAHDITGDGKPEFAIGPLGGRATPREGERCSGSSAVPTRRLSGSCTRSEASRPHTASAGPTPTGTAVLN